MNILRENSNKIHTTPLGEMRIRKNTGKTSEWCRDEIQNCSVEKRGKNYYCTTNNICIVINAKSFTIITAHKIK